MSLHTADWLKLIGVAALAATGIGAVGAGGLAAAGAGGASAAGAAGASGAAAGGMGSTLGSTLGSALISQGVGAGISAATPKTGMTVPGQTPQLGGMDLNALVEQSKQHQTQLPSLALRKPFQQPY